MADLLPCPFCGSTNLRYEFAGSQGYIECNECGTEGPCDERAADPYCDDDAACDAWNRRAALAEPEPEGLTDDELDDLAAEAGLDLAWRPELRRFARLALARNALAQLTPQTPADGKVVELPPRPPLMEPPAHPALERYGITWDGSPDKPLLTRRADGYWTPWHVAADLLERQQTVPDELTDEELLKAWDAPQYEPLSNNDVLMGLRDVIAADRSRWGRPMPLPSGEVERD